MNAIKIPESISNQINFNKLFSMKPKENNDVLVYNKDT
mgnify:CR=1 FL=1